MSDLIEPILPGGIVGNSKMLCSIGSNGRLHRLFWPNIDWGQHMGILKTGIQEQGGPVHWLDSDCFRHRQFYHEDNNIFTTIAICEDENINISQTDFVLPDQDILVRYFTMQNNRDAVRTFNLIAYCSFSIEETHTQDGMCYMPKEQALMQFRRNYYFGLNCPGKTPYGFHCGRRGTPSDPIHDAGVGKFHGGSDNIKSGAGAMGWKIGTVGPGDKISFLLVLAAAHNEDSLSKLLNQQHLKNPQALMEQVSVHWKKWISLSSNSNLPNSSLYKRSLLAIKLMSDQSSGASIAAPEFDSHYLASGGYGYCWPRDGMFVALALDEAGYHHEAEMFYRFASRVQNPDGSWQQRYFSSGDPAPTWGQQIDQVGSVLWGYFHHFNLTGNKKFINDIWPSVRSGVAYLQKNRLPDNGLPIPTMDIWEDEFAQSTYASAAVYGGLNGASNIALAIGDITSSQIWRDTAESIKQSILSKQWIEDQDNFVRSVNRRVSEWDYYQVIAKKQEAYLIQSPPNLYNYHAVAVDHRLDISLLALNFPFNVLPSNDRRLQSTADKIEKILLNNQVGGIHRYEGDTYAGGNPWVLATLWLSIYKSLQGLYSQAGEYLKWAENNSSPAGLMPEQVHRDKGGPAWVLPLNWSHAMYVLAFLALYGKLNFFLPKIKPDRSS